MVTDVYSYLRTHAIELGSRILETYPPLQSTKDPVAPRIATLLRRALPAQALAITGTAKYLRKAKANGVTTWYLVEDDVNPTGLPQVLEEKVGGAVQRVYTYGLQRISQDQFVNSSARCLRVSMLTPLSCIPAVVMKKPSQRPYWTEIPDNPVNTKSI